MRGRSFLAVTAAVATLALAAISYAGLGDPVVGPDPNASGPATEPIASGPPPAPILPRATARAPGTIVFTFDDTSRHDLASAAMLEAYGFRGTYYVVTGFLGSGPAQLGPEDLVALRGRGHDIQSHTVSHPDLTTLSDADLRRELERSKVELEEILQAPVRHLAYPYGAHDERVVEAAKLSYHSARAATDDVEATRIDDPFRTPGIVLKRDTSVEDAKRYVDLAVKEDRTVIFLLEAITTQPTEWDWTTSQFGALLDHVAKQGPAVKTIDEAFTPPAPPAPTATGRVVLTFDDGLTSQLRAATILENHGHRGTFYVASGLLRSGPAPAPYMSAAEVATLSARGHDIGSITSHHRDLRTLDDETLHAELMQSRITLGQISDRPVRHMAYPFNSFDERVLEATRLAYETGRTVNGDLENADPYQVPGVPIVRNTSVETIVGYVDHALANDLTIVLVLHDVSWTPSEIGWTPAQLEALLDHVDASGVPVRTISDLYP